MSSPEHTVDEIQSKDDSPVLSDPTFPTPLSPDRTHTQEKGGRGRSRSPRTDSGKRYSRTGSGTTARGKTLSGRGTGIARRSILRVTVSEGGGRKEERRKGEKEGTREAVKEGGRKRGRQRKGGEERKEGNVKK